MEPLINYYDALAFRRFRWQHALPPAGVGLSGQCNEAGGLI
ncbi:MAG: hypothetical protein R3F50_20260 [Gammaproteobacteria bacterium]